MGGGAGDLSPLRPNRGWASEPPPTTYFVRGLLLRLLAGVYLVAFASFWVQAEGLIGPHGILPVSAFLDAARQQIGEQAYRQLPTVLWLSGSAAALHLVCAAGVVLSLAAIAGLRRSSASHCCGCSTSRSSRAARTS